MTRRLITGSMTTSPRRWRAIRNTGKPAKLRHQRAGHAGGRDRGGRRHHRLCRHHRRRDRLHTSSRSIFARFLEGAQSWPTSRRIWDQMYLSTLYYGRKGLVVNAISGVDLALWDLLGKLRGEPVYQLLGGASARRD